METIDLTPTWSGILPALLTLYDNEGESRQTAVDELEKMARCADLYNESVKGKNESSTD